MRDEIRLSPKGRSVSQERHQSPKDHRERSLSVDRSCRDPDPISQERNVRDSYERRSIRGRKQVRLQRALKIFCLLHYKLDN